MRRFFIPQIDISKNEFTILDPVQVHHIKDVLRFKQKDKIQLFDADANEYECLIKSMDFKRIVVSDIKLIKTRVKENTSIRITLACAIPKKGKFDYIVEKSTELGVDLIIPMITEHSIVKLDSFASDNKLARWQRIAIEASKQCSRLGVPKIENPQKFDDIMRKSGDFDALLLPNLSSRERLPIIRAIEGLKLKRNILLLIGPEGDFSEKELALSVTKNATMLTLGETVLKVETAAIVCVAFLCLYLKGRT